MIAKFQELDASCTTVSQAVEDKTVYNAIQDGIDYYNTHLANLDDALKVCLALALIFSATCKDLDLCIASKIPNTHFKSQI